jgi:hypothetical protein
MKYLLLILLSLTILGQVNAENMYEFSANAGVTFPHGTFHRYTDNGAYGHARLVAHMNSFKAISIFTDLSVSLFSTSEEDVIISDDIFIYDARRRISEYSVALHIGTLIGSDSRNSFFRPKFGIAGGLYLFNIQTLILDPLFDDEELADDNQTQVRVGWRGIIGTDLFFTPKWGLSFEFTYDHVLNLHHSLEYIPGVGLTNIGQSARFSSFSVGVILPIH